MCVLRFSYASLRYAESMSGSVDEAGLYLSTFKQYEHKPPDMIKERIDKDYSSVLRTALTSISRVNKTDVETLRTSLGVGFVNNSIRWWLTLIPFYEYRALGK